ncbi:hypothetical protein DFH09DRAFT_1456184 [Mycena vulgaris]|nr:hypothetical protein DFH09DRAFT_1456184 [Mycena vulgaris]
MDGGSRVATLDAIIRGFDWSTYSEGSLVDVGGGGGSQCMALARHYPQPPLAVQDRAPVIREGVVFWIKGLSSYLEPGKVLLEAGAQGVCVSPPDVLHDWSDEYCVKILPVLRAAADS